MASGSIAKRQYTWSHFRAAIPPIHQRRDARVSGWHRDCPSGIAGGDNRAEPLAAFAIAG